MSRRSFWNAIPIFLSGAVAWFQVNGTISLAGTSNQGKIAVANDAEVSGLEITVPVIWNSGNAIPGVELTAGANHVAVGANGDAQTIGGTYVVDASGNVRLASNNGTVTKSKLIPFTLDATIANMTKFGGTAATVADFNQLTSSQTYYVTVWATGNIRLATTRSGTSSGERPDNNYVGAYTVRTHVEVGKLTVSHTTDATTLTYTYDADSKATSTATTTPGTGNFGVYYSVSPIDDDGNTGETAGADSTGAYGKIYVTLSTGAYASGQAANPDA